MFIESIGHIDSLSGQFCSAEEDPGTQSEAVEWGKQVELNKLSSGSKEAAEKAWFVALFYNFSPVACIRYPQPWETVWFFETTILGMNWNHG